MKVDLFGFGAGAPLGASQGVALLAGELAARGHDVRLCPLDPRAAPGPAAALAAARGAEVAAVSFASVHALPARVLVAALHAALPAARIVCGGAHPTVAPDEVGGWPGVSAVGRGECDGVFADLVDAWAAGVALPATPGFRLRRPDGGVQDNPLPSPPSLEGPGAFCEALDVRGSVAADHGRVSLTVTRGCPYRCAHCAGWVTAPGPLDRCRRRSVGDAVAAVRRLVRRAGDAARLVVFDDDPLLADPEWFGAFAARLAAEVGLPYIATGAVDRVDAEVARVLARTGCLLLRVDLRTTVPRLARLALRPARPPEVITRAFRVLHDHGVSAGANVFFGIPTETRADVEATLSTCAAAGADAVDAAFLLPVAGTELHDYCAANGLLPPDASPPRDAPGSPLRWPPDHELFLQKALTLFPWLLSATLPTSPAAPVYRGFAEEAIAMDADTWARPGVQRFLRETTLRLDRSQRRAGIPHYLAPFPDRPGRAFLVRPDRPRPLPQVDDAWPPDAPWRREPVP